MLSCLEFYLCDTYIIKHIDNFYSGSKEVKKNGIYAWTLINHFSNQKISNTYIHRCLALCKQDCIYPLYSAKLMIS